MIALSHPENGGRWNPRYFAYALMTGSADPEAAFERDGGNHHYSCWIGDHWCAWSDAVGQPRSSHKTPDDHAAFDAWLDARVIAFLSEQSDESSPRAVACRGEEP